MNEINKDYYCSSGNYKDDWCMESDSVHTSNCANCYSKHPTPSQFKEEYGYEYPDDGAVYLQVAVEIKRSKKGRIERIPTGEYNWKLFNYDTAKTNKDVSPDRYGEIVCACTPFGKPDEEWKP